MAPESTDSVLGRLEALLGVVVEGQKDLRAELKAILKRLDDHYVEYSDLRPLESRIKRLEGALFGAAALALIAMLNKIYGLVLL